jgi:hypothetical protein
MKQFIVFILIFLYVSTWADSKPFSEETVGIIIAETAKKNNIDPKVLYTIASIESDFKPLAIAVETTAQSAGILESLRSKDIKVVYDAEKSKTFHSKISVISLYPKNIETAKFIIKILKKYNFCFDVGLMQINTFNFTEKEVEEMFYPKKNIEKAAEIYGHCERRFRTLKHRVECYNRGKGNLSKDLKRKKFYYPYWKRFKKHYKGYFGHYPK